MPNEKLQKELEPLFNLKPEKAIDYFNKKVALGPRKHWDWTDTMRQAHDRVFVVAKATSIDLVKDIQSELSKSLQEGIPYQDFANNIIPKLKERGWWGSIDAENKDQGIVKPIKVDHRRLRNIYNTNVKTAYAAGRYEQMMDETDIAPYWRYVAVPKGAGNKNPRVEHAALHNLVFRYDDPFWQTHYAPNGWGCHCTVVNMTKRALEKKFGKKAEEVVRKSKPEDFVTTTEEFEREHIKNDGSVEMQKVKITTTGYKIGGKVIYPSRGWDYAPGSYSLDFNQLLEEKITSVPENAKLKMLEQLSDSLKKSFENIIENESLMNMPTKRTFVAGMIPEDVYEKLKKRNPSLNLETRLLTLSDESIIHSLRSNHDAIPKEILKKLPEIISSWECTYDENRGLRFWSPFVSKEDSQKRYVVVFTPDIKKNNKLTLTTAYSINKKDFREKNRLK
ncbi:MAG: phage head morphogenesis protein [Fibrobacter sp.]|nr:phage head morphogenesis protein [Fibrobacter sp.]